MEINNSNLYTNLYHLYIALHDMPFISLCIVLTQLFGASFQRLPRHLPIGNVPGRIECRDPEFSILVQSFHVLFFSGTAKHGEAELSLQAKKTMLGPPDRNE